MAELGFSFDPNSVEPAADMSAMPNGEYVAMIIDSEVVTAKSGNGKYLKLTFQVIEGEYSKRYVWHNLNLWNNNETAAKIAAQQLAAISIAVDHMGQVVDSAELHNKPMVIKVAFIPPSDGYKEKNEIKAFKKLDGAQQPQVAMQQQAAQPQTQQAGPLAGAVVQNAAAGSDKPMWAR